MEPTKTVKTENKKMIKAERNNVILSTKEDDGRVMIADDVISEVAAMAALEVEGVTMPGVKTKGVATARVNSKYVKTEVVENEVKVSILLSLAYGCPIPTTCKQVQNKVKNSIENMTGLSVTEVNIRISEVIAK